MPKFLIMSFVLVLCGTSIAVAQDSRVKEIDVAGRLIIAQNVTLPFLQSELANNQFGATCESLGQFNVYAYDVKNGADYFASKLKNDNLADIASKLHVAINQLPGYCDQQKKTSIAFQNVKQLNAGLSEITDLFAHYCKEVRCDLNP